MAILAFKFMPAPKVFYRTSAALMLIGAASLAQPASVGYDGARHLLNRTGFAASQAEVESFAGLTREQAAQRVLDASPVSAVTSPPAWINDALISPRTIQGMSEEARKQYRRDMVQKGLELRAWWLTEMLTTASPLTEKMTLFWHNHFVSSQQKVKYNQLMYRQNVLLRRHALGSFAVLLHEVARDPAMIIYLDSVSNRKGQPNENFAREAMELFTVGEGHYSEQDIKEAARAFTGWSLERETGGFIFRPALHDDGVKTVLGKSGPLNGDDVLDILLAQPATAEFIVGKLWREFISPTPQRSEVLRFAKIFRASGYQIKPLLHAMLTSAAFYAPENRAALVKSPVELLLGTLKQFDIQSDNLQPVAVASAVLGQNLFSPPNVKGWPGGTAWINSATLLGRKQILTRLFPDQGEFIDTARPVGDGPDKQRVNRMAREFNAMAFDADRWFTQAPPQRDGLVHLLLAAAPEQPPPAGQTGVAFIRTLILDSAYQLK